MPSAPIPAAECPIDHELVAALVRAQHPDLASLSVAPFANGWDNVLFRLGESLLVRLPRHADGARLMANELRWVPTLAARLPLPIAAPIRAGAPALGYPFPWSISRFHPGENAGVTPPRDAERTASQLGGFLAALHTPAPLDAPHNAYRGIPLTLRTPMVEKSLEQLADVLDARVCAELGALWADLSLSEPWSEAPSWIHGDLHPANLLVHDGEIAAVLDFGDLCAGDPATDLAVAWMLLPERAHARFWEAAGRASDARIKRRAKAWALAIAVAALAGSADDPLIQRLARRTLDNVRGSATDES